MDQIVSPVLLFVCLALGALGVYIALPKRGSNPQAIGGLIAATGFGVVIIALGWRAWQQDELPNLFFYVFAAIALGSALRMITHQKPVYAALYFILTILSSASLYLLLHAEFMAFALIIIYAGAILITYLFVIMLATQSPSEDRPEGLMGYDLYSRDPAVASMAGFVLIAALTGLLARGVVELEPNEAAATPASLVTEMPRKVLRALEHRGVFAGLGEPEVGDVGGSIDVDSMTLDLAVRDAEAFAASLEDPRVAELMPEDAAGAGEGAVVTVTLPEEALVGNADGVGHALIAEHPMMLEVAGVILLMAMLGAVVLARKQIELTEDEKARAAEGSASGGVVVQTPGTGMTS